MTNLTWTLHGEPKDPMCSCVACGKAILATQCYADIERRCRKLEAKLWRIKLCISGPNQQADGRCPIFFSTNVVKDQTMQPPPHLVRPLAQLTRNIECFRWVIQTLRATVDILLTMALLYIAGAPMPAFRNSNKMYMKAHISYGIRWLLLQFRKQ